MRGRGATICGPRVSFRGPWVKMRGGRVMRGPWAVIRGPWVKMRGPWVKMRGPWVKMRGPWVKMRGPWVKMRGDRVMRGPWAMMRGAPATCRVRRVIRSLRTTCHGRRTVSAGPRDPGLRLKRAEPAGRCPGSNGRGDWIRQLRTLIQASFIPMDRHQARCSRCPYGKLTTICHQVCRGRFRLAGHPIRCPDL